MWEWGLFNDNLDITLDNWNKDLFIYAVYLWFEEENYDKRYDPAKSTILNICILLVLLLLFLLV